MARLLERGPIPVPQAIVVGLGVLAGLRELQRRGLGHGAIDTSTVLVDRRGQARLLGGGSADANPNADVVAAGRVLCAALGVDPDHEPRVSRHPTEPGFLEGLAAAARTMAAGGAGASARNALVMFGDAAGRMGHGLRIQRTAPAIEHLAIPPPSSIVAAVDALMRPGRMRPPAAAIDPVTPPAAVAAPAPERVKAATIRPAPAPRVAAIDRRAEAPRPVNARRRRHPLGALAISLVIGGACLLGALLVLPRHQPSHRSPGAVLSAAAPASPAALAEAAPPDGVVTQFYRLVAAHQFDQALALWDDTARTTLGPSQYPSQRFAGTTQMDVNGAKVTSNNGSTAVVAVDLTEQTDGVLHHWVGTWRLVKSNGAWLLDMPAFQEA